VRFCLGRARVVVLPGAPPWPVSLLLRAKPSLEDCYGGAHFGPLGKLGPHQLGVDGVVGHLAGRRYHDADGCDRDRRISRQRRDRQQAEQFSQLDDVGKLPLLAWYWWASLGRFVHLGHGT
jgi:hypothetical protein